jgi:hypothetical protein
VADRPLDAAELAAIASWLETHRPKQCPRTGTGEALPFLRMTAKDHVRLAFQLANARRAAEAKARAV